MRSIVENEARNYWCALAELRQAIADDLQADVIDYHLEEIRGIMINTDLPMLRERCRATLQELRPTLLDDVGA